MPDTNRSGTTIEKLLEERSQYEQWLARLDDAGAPDAVRTRVRTDYQARLQGVMEQLRAHGTTIAAELERHETERGELSQREAEVQETLTEAEVRHSVGEYGDAKWNEISKAQEAALSQVRSQLDRVRAEIGRLSEVHRLITAPVPAPEPVPAPPAARAPEPARPPAPEPAVTSYSAPAEAATPRFVPKPPAAARLPGDELDFIKSVNVEQASSLSPSAAERQRSSGAQPIVTTTTPLPETAVPSPAPAPPAPSPKPGSQPPSANKTLKCADCGTLNRATEWYCERCGAELAAL